MIYDLIIFCAGVIVGICMSETGYTDKLVDELVLKYTRYKKPSYAQRILNSFKS